MGNCVGDYKWGENTEIPMTDEMKYDLYRFLLNVLSPISQKKIFIRVI
jgi:hypothetical protein